MKHQFKRPALWGYGILIVVVILGFVQLENTNNRLNQEIIHRQEAICNSFDSLKGVLSSIVARTEPLEVMDEEEVSRDLEIMLNRSRERNERFRDFVNEVLSETECPEGPMPAGLRMENRSWLGRR